MKSKASCMPVIFGLLVPALIVLRLAPSPAEIMEKNRIQEGVSNCRRIISALRAYAADHGGDYPDKSLANPRGSNEVFRILFKEDIVTNERIFGCPLSPFVPDGNIGDDANHAEALKAGENHWAMTAGLDDSATGYAPLVYENPAIATWPPAWNLDARGTPTRGRSWRGGVILGSNDSSVSLHPLALKKGTEVPLRKHFGTDTEEKDSFEVTMDPATLTESAVLDVD
ncbi:hypothetical protein [Roseimicrobium gellanilyticum]|nr:hypothetical protein [Roseimicrobium gellanilyticum]